MLAFLVTLTVLLTAADHWTTYLCLRDPIPGWQVTEANPLAAWLFDAIGLAPAIALDSVLTLLAIAFLTTTRYVPGGVKHGFFAAVVLWTAWAVVNNLGAIRQLGLSPWATA